jgi:predicted GTPase
MFLIGNKADCQANCKVNITKAAEFAKEVKSKLYETSAKEGTGIDNLFNDVAAKLYEHKMSEQDEDYNIEGPKTKERPISSSKSFALDRDTKESVRKNAETKKDKKGCC